MLLSCSAKKVTKEGGIGEALRVALPRAKAALSYVPLPARTCDSKERFILPPVQVKSVPTFYLKYYYSENRQSGESGAGATCEAVTN